MNGRQKETSWRVSYETGEPSGLPFKLLGVLGHLKESC